MDEVHIGLFGGVKMNPDVGVAEGCHENSCRRVEADGNGRREGNALNDGYLFDFSALQSLSRDERGERTAIAVSCLNSTFSFAIEPFLFLSILLRT